MDTTDKDIYFNKDGICNHCLLYSIKNSLTSDQKNTNLNIFLKEIKKKSQNKKYDCIIGLSGGVDSTYVAYLVKKVFKLNPLAVHLDNGWNSELAVKNIENIVIKLDIDLITYVIDWEEFKDIQLSFLKSSTPDIEVPTDHAIFSILRKIRKKYKVPYIISGINSATESHHPLSWSQGHIDFLYIKSIQNKFGTKKIVTYPHGSFFTIFTQYFSKHWFNILDFVEYDKEKAKKIIIEDLDWVDYGGKHFESIFTRFYQGYILPRKFNIDKRKMHLSSLICSNKISKFEAIKILDSEPYPIELQIQDLNFVLNKFNLTEDQFKYIMKSKIKSYIDYNSYYGVFLNSLIYKNLISLYKKFKK
jgi:N-acetyl sugar amidotransferase